MKPWSHNRPPWHPRRPGRWKHRSPRWPRPHRWWRGWKASPCRRRPEAPPTGPPSGPSMKLWSRRHPPWPPRRPGRWKPRSPRWPRPHRWWRGWIASPCRRRRVSSPCGPPSGRSPPPRFHNRRPWPLRTPTEPPRPKCRRRSPMSCPNSCLPCCRKSSWPRLPLRFAGSRRGRFGSRPRPFR